MQTVKNDTVVPTEGSPTILFNYYEGVGIPSHSDSEKEYWGRRCNIISYSTGDTATFNMKCPREPEKKISTTVESGDVVLMSDCAQIDFKHDVQMCSTRVRLSATLRWYIHGEDRSHEYLL
jgi:alkylated DNA repair dioxygenase AlkB